MISHYLLTLKNDILICCDFYLDKCILYYISFLISIIYTRLIGHAECFLLKFQNILSKICVFLVNVRLRVETGCNLSTMDDFDHICICVHKRLQRTRKGTKKDGTRLRLRPIYVFIDWNFKQLLLKKHI